MTSLPWLPIGVVEGFDPTYGMTHPESATRYLVESGQRRNIRFEPNNEPLGALEYERQIQRGAIPTRDCLHDWFNGVVWMHFPNTKQHISALHVTDAIAAGAGANNDLSIAAQTKLRGGKRGNARSRKRDALTLFDESGLVLLTANQSLSDGLREHRWHEVFVANRGIWGRGAELIVFGHGLMESMLQPHKGLCGKVLHVICTEAQWKQWLDLGNCLSERYRWLDERLCAEVADLTLPLQLSPLPVMGVPGWFDSNQAPEFYDDVTVFRQKPTR